MKCKLVVGSAEAFKLYNTWGAARGLAPAGTAEGWIFVALAGNTGLLLLSGAFVRIHADHAELGGFLAAPGLRSKALWMVGVLTARTAMATATTLGRQLRAPAPTRGIARLLQAQGWLPAGPALPGVMFVEPGVGPFEVPLPEAPKRSPRVAQTARAPEPKGTKQPTGNRRMRRAAAAAKR